VMRPAIRPKREDLMRQRSREMLRAVSKWLWTQPSILVTVSRVPISRLDEGGSVTLGIALLGKVRRPIRVVTGTNCAALGM
jgi:hypothetical protein